ncbi:MAG: hypothetical protein NTZ78_02575 [Candidatus Aureabacteria bacterium]|nr:hypothetical protein [Candidatus Auribacterota bacterium]
MKIDLSKTVFTPQETGFIVDRLRLAAERGYVTCKSENNSYLLASLVGVEGKGITPKWNVKIYTYNKKKDGHSLVCTDKYILGKLLEGDYDSFIPPDLLILKIDDAGWGFPLCGVMVGVSDEKNVHTDLVPVEYFRDDTENRFQTKRYLKKYENLALQLLGRFGASPDTHRIEICTGHVNQPLREELRNLGYDVRVVEIKGMLQDKLEEIYREYVLAEIGSDIYYDPKDIKKSEIPRRYRETLEFGRKHCPHKIKTGWNAVSGN